MSVVVLGSAGLLGSHMLRAFRGARGFNHRECDVTRYEDVERAVDGASMVINCAAYTNADRAEDEGPKAFDVNVLGPSLIASLCGKATLVHISSDSVFDGEQRTAYSVGSLPHPISIYGRSKYDGEQQLELRSAGTHYIIRVQGLYGDGGRNFASQIVGKLRRGETLRVDCERRTQPTWALAAALQIARLVRERPPGTYHVSCTGETTWYDFARVAAEELRVPASIIPLPTIALGLTARRPRNCLFSHGALGESMQMLSWRETLRTYIQEAEL